MRSFLLAVALWLTPHLVWAQSSVTTYPLSGPTPNVSGTITTGGTFQQAAAAVNPGGRFSIDFQNRSGNGDACYLYFGTTAAANTAGTGKAIKVADGQEYLRSNGAIPSDAVQVTCTTTSDAFYLAVQ